MEQPNKTPTVPMYCATGAVKTGPARIGHVAGNISLPRSIEIYKAVAIVIGVFIGVIIAALVPAGGVQKFIYSGILFGAAGWLVTSFSPLRGESMLTWIGLSVNTLRRQKMIDGKPVIVSVGCAVMDREPQGKLMLARSSLRVPAGRYDERGVLNPDVRQTQNFKTSHMVGDTPPGVKTKKSDKETAKTKADKTKPAKLKEKPKRKKETTTTTSPLSKANRQQVNKQ